MNNASLLPFSPEDLINQIAYPEFGQNARRKWTEKYDELTVAAGTNRYQFFQTPPAQPFIRNYQFPPSGNEVIFVTNINLLVGGAAFSITPAIMEQMAQILALSYLNISVNDKRSTQIPLLEILQFWYAEDTVNANDYVYVNREKKLMFPIIINSNSNTAWTVVLSDAAATLLNTATLSLAVKCIQFDKLDTYFYDVWKGSSFERVDFSMYDVLEITGAGQLTYNLFERRNVAPNFCSKFLNLSDIERMDVNAIEVGFFNPDNDITPEAFFENKRNNILDIRIEDTTIFNGRVKDMMTNVQVETLVTSKYLYQTLVLRVPITLPANSNVLVQLTQPAGTVFSAEDTQYFICDLKGVLTRRIT